MSVWVTEHSCISLSLQQQNLYYKYETRTKKLCYRSTENTLDRHSLIWHLRSSRPISLLASMQSETHWLPPWNVGKKKKERERERGGAKCRSQASSSGLHCIKERSEIRDLWDLGAGRKPQGWMHPRDSLFWKLYLLAFLSSLLSTFHLPPLCIASFSSLNY